MVGGTITFAVMSHPSVGGMTVVVGAVFHVVVMVRVSRAAVVLVVRLIVELITGVSLLWRGLLPLRIVLWLVVLLLLLVLLWLMFLLLLLLN